MTRQDVLERIADAVRQVDDSLNVKQQEYQQFRADAVERRDALLALRLRLEQNEASADAVADYQTLVML